MYIVKVAVVTTLTKLSHLVPAIKNSGKSVGLITGCFDILHSGHIDLIRFAKRNCDVLILGLESDATIRLSKGPERPIHNFRQRSKVLSELISIDYIFKIPIVIKFGFSEEVKNKYVKMTMKIKPDYMFTSKTSDKYLNNKILGARQMGAKLLVFKPLSSLSSSQIANRLKSEI